MLKTNGLKNDFGEPLVFLQKKLAASSRLALVPIFVLAVCLPGLAFAGIIIGHPVGTKIADASGLAVDFAELPVHRMTVDRCDGSTETFLVDQTLDLVVGDPLTLPNGWVCGVAVQLGGRVHLSGVGTDGGSFSMSLAVGSVQLDVSPALFVDDTSSATGVRFAHADWVTVGDLGLSAGTHVHVNPSHTLHDVLRDAWRFDGAVTQ